METSERGRAVAPDSVLDLIRTRRSVRRYSADPVAEEDLVRLAEAGRWAPSGSNRQPCVFVAVDDPGTLEALEAFAPGIIGRPAAVLAVCLNRSRFGSGESDESLPAMDAAMAAQNILLEAWSLGLGSCPVLSFDPESVERLLGLPGELKLALLIALGYPAGPVRVLRRRPLAEILHRNSFGTAFPAASLAPFEGGSPGGPSAGTCAGPGAGPSAGGRGAQEGDPE